MKHRKKIIGVTAAVMLVTLLTAVPVLAQSMPCIFTGDVTLNGEPYEPGGVITIELADGTPVSTIVPVIVTATSEYGAAIAQEGDVPAEGATLNFYVDGLFGGSSTWEAGQVKTLALAVETDEGPPPSPSTDWLLVGAIVAACVVAGLVLFLVRRRRTGTA